MDSNIVIAIATVVNVIVVCIIGYLTLNNSKNLKDIEEKNLKLNEAQTELYIQELLVNARKLFIEMTMHQLGKEIQEKGKNAFLTMLKQEVLNSYEVACAKYLDDKVDKERFKKTYIKEIRELFTSFKDMLSNENSYQAIKEVNTEWNNLEKK